MDVGKIKCFFGMHRYSFHAFANRYGVAFGDRCARCGLWHKSAIKKALP